MGATTYQLWQAGPWDLPRPGKAKETSVAEEANEARPRLRAANTRNIVEKNLFDPERGANRTQEAEASAIATQRIRSMVLLGTAILGGSRYAIMQEPAASGAPAVKSQPGSSGQRRLKLGDTVEGFKLSEVREKSVVFTKGASRVEVAIDFFRPVEQPAPRAPIPPRPAVAPRAGAGVAPSGEAAPQTPAKQDNSTQAEKARNAPRRERQLQPPQQPERRLPQRVPRSSGETAPAESPE